MDDETYVARSAVMLEFETWSCVMPKSALMVMVNWTTSGQHTIHV
jgi:hypothetical protein